MRRLFALLGGAAALLGPAGTATAGDSRTAPDPLHFSAAGSADTRGFGVDAGEPVSAQGGCPARGATAWWRIAGTGQSITLSTVNPGTDFNTVLTVLTGTPQSGTRIACDDDVAGDPLRRSRVSFASVRGTAYFVQVGGIDTCAAPLTPCPEVGTVVLSASAPRPANDDRSAAEVLATGVASSGSTVGASQEPGEDTTCGSAGFAATVWYRWSAPSAGSATFAASAAFDNLAGNRSDTVLAVERDGARVGCDDDGAGQLAGPSALTLPVTPGDYLVQVGARGTEGVTPVGEGGVSVRVDLASAPAATPVPTPDATPVPTGTPAPTELEEMPVRVVFFFRPRRPKRVTTFTQVHATRIPRGSTVVARCLDRRGKPCRGRRGRAFRREDVRGTLAIKAFERSYPAGTRLRITVSKPGFETRAKIIEVRRGKRPDVTDRCRQPPAPAFVRC